MLHLTPAAASHLNTLLSAKAAPAKAAVRIVRDPSGELHLLADVPTSADVGFEFEGKTVLILDNQVSELLNNRVLDVVASPQGETLTLKPTA
jgi:Fe-S cluster assembly iron-binding protein IscA